MRSAILLISDHEDLGRQVREILTREGEQVPPANVLSLAHAGSKLNHESPDLIIVVLPPEPDRALEVVSQIAGRDKARAVAVGPASDTKLVLRAIRGGIDDYVDVDDLEAELKAALVCWRASRTQAKPGKVISILAPSGGSGSSTLAVNVAAGLSKVHSATALIDLKLHTGDLAALLDLKPTYTLADLCVNVARIDRTFFERTLVRHASGIHLLAPPRSLSDVGHVTSDGIRQALVHAQAIFPYVVVDLDHSFGEEQKTVLLHSDVVVIVMRLDFTSLRNTRRAVEYLDEIGVNKGRIRLVANRYGQPKEVPAAKVEEALGLKITHYIPDDPKAVNRANNLGVPLVLDAPSARVSKRLIELAASVNGRDKAH